MVNDLMIHPNRVSNADLGPTCRGQRRRTARSRASQNIMISLLSCLQIHAGVSLFVLSIPLTDRLVTQAKHFSKSLSSFALVPNSRPFSITTEVMVVNKEGDLELYALHDTPKQTAWSSRGDLAIGGGLSYKIFPGFQEEHAPFQPSDAALNHGDDGSVFHGRGKQSNLPLTSGRGTGDGLPAFSTDSVGGRLPTSEIFSSASFRNYPLDASIVSTVTSRADHSVERSTQRQVSRKEVKSKVQRTNVDKSSSRNRKNAPRAIQQIVEDDISMTMRSRAMRGYGIGSVRTPTIVLHQSL